MTKVDHLYRAIYFAVQRGRAGVTPDLIDEAKSVLEMPRDRWRARALQRLRDVHGKDVTWEWLRERRLVDRRTLSKQGSEVANQERWRKVEKRKTSGSTGTPFVFAKDRQMTAWMDAAMWSVYAWHGIEPGQPHVRFWGTPLQPAKRMKKTLKDLLLHRKTIGAFDLSEQSVRQGFRVIRRMRPTYAYGYPTLMRAFADLCERSGFAGTALGLNLVIVTGEVLSPSAREKLRRFFGCPIVNEYGCTESGIIGFECEDGTMHSVPVAAWPEVVDEAGTPQTNGEEGEIVVSDLYGTIMPLLRYRLHDRGAQSVIECSCGRDLPQVSVTSGRSDSFIETPKGRVYDAILAYAVPEGVQRFRVFQVAPDRLRAHIVPATGSERSEIARVCKKRWEEVLAPGMTVEVEIVENIPLEPSGKLRYFVPLAETERGDPEGR